MAEQVIHDLSAGERGVTIMLAGKLTPPAFIEVENESGLLLQRYTPSALDDAERKLTVQLVKAVKLALFCFNMHWPSSPPMRHMKADVVGSLNRVVAKAEALLAEKVEEPDPPCIVPPAQDDNETEERG